MAAITNFKWTQTGLPNQNGRGTVSVGRGTYPASTASATALVVGNLSSYDLVEVYPIQAVTGVVGLIEIKASRTTSGANGQGSVIIGNIDGGTGASSTVDFELRVYRN